MPRSIPTQPGRTGDQASPSPAAPGLVEQVYRLLTDTRFAIIVLIALAVASVIGLIVIDQLPWRGELARGHFAGRESTPLVWALIHLVPLSPFRSLLFRALLALLSLSLLACTIKRWRHHWRRALTIALPGENTFASPAVLHWTTRAARDAPREPSAPGAAGEADRAGARHKVADLVAAYLKQRLFVVRRLDREDSTTLSAVRFGFSEMGSILTHLGLLLLVLGGIVLASTGFSRLVWLRPGEDVAVPAKGFRVGLDDFQVQMTPSGRISDYISTVSVYEGDRPVRQARVEVNHPLRHQGYSFYQSSYRQDPTRVRSVDLLYDALVMEDLAFAARAGGLASAAAEHRELPARLEVPMTITVPWGTRVPVPDTPFAVEIDTFLADFRIEADGPRLASEEFHNPAVRLHVFAGDSLAGAAWHFLLHPGMPVGSGLVLPVRFADVHPIWMTGLEVSTHPGSPLVWAGIALMSLGSILVFLLRRDQIWLRARRTGEGYEIALAHPGATRQAPEFVREAWEKEASPLAIRIVRLLEPAGAPPVRGKPFPSAGPQPEAGRNA